MKRRARPDDDPLSSGRPTAAGAVPVNEAALVPYNSYGSPDFVTRGYYLDRPFRCAACGTDQVWTARQQKWWYETARGGVLDREAVPALPPPPGAYFSCSRAFLAVSACGPDGATSTTFWKSARASAVRPVLTSASPRWK